MPLPTGNHPPFVGPPNTPPPNVSVGKVLADDAPYNLSANDLTIDLDYMVNNHFEKDHHVYMLGITSPGGFNGQSAAFVKLAADTLIWVSRWTASRSFEPPLIPDPNLIDLNWVLLDEHVTPAMLIVSSEGQTPIYRISGTYVYGCINPDPTLVKNTNFAKPPWLDDVFNRSMVSRNLTQGIIGPPGNGLGGAGAGAGFQGFLGS